MQGMCQEIWILDGEMTLKYPDLNWISWGKFGYR
jgi:hypothetical protein